MDSKVINLFQPEQNNPALYNKSINQMIVYFKKEMINLDESLIGYINLIIEGWNIANLRSRDLPDMPLDYFRHLGVSLHEHILEKVIAYKTSHFKDLTLYIYEYELVNEKTPQINILQLLNHDAFSVVMLQDKMSQNTSLEDVDDNEDFDDDFFDDDFDDDFFDDDEFEDETDNEEGYLDRHILIVKPKQPFFDWANEISQSTQKIETTMFRSYLISDDVNPKEWLKKNYKRIFTLECYEMTHFIEEVPKKTNYKMFQDWFTVEASISIYDLETKKIEKF